MTPKFMHYFVLLFIISSFGLFLRFASHRTNVKGLQHDTEEKYPVFLNEQLPATPSTAAGAGAAGSLSNNVGRPKFFFAGVLSTCDSVGSMRRSLIRKWMSQYASHQYPNLVDYVFLLDDYHYGSEPYSCVEKLEQEQQQYGDLKFFRLDREQTGWTKIIYKVEKMIQYLGDHFLFDKYRYIVKTDDDALVRYDLYENVLREQVDSPFIKSQAQQGTTQHSMHSSTKQEYLTRSLFAYSGVFLTGSKVFTGGARGDDEFLNDTGINFYVKYAAGACYAFSSALGKTIYFASKAGNLKKWGNEDATFGHWVSSFHHIKHSLSGLDSLGSCDPRSLLFHPIKDLGKMELMIQAFVDQQDAPLACKIYQGNHLKGWNWLSQFFT